MPRPRVLLSQRKTKRIVRLYAVIVEDVDGIEGVVRVTTPLGTFGYVTDDPALAPELLHMARAKFPDAYLGTFHREE